MIGHYCGLGEVIVLKTPDNKRKVPFKLHTTAVHTQFYPVHPIGLSTNQQNLQSVKKKVMNCHSINPLDSNSQ